jgi:hypothetical protein
MHRAMMMCATMEISTLPFAFTELFTPSRSFIKIFALVTLLRRRYSCTDNTVFRIKYTYYDSGYYHRQFWTMVDAKTAPLVNRYGPVASAVGKVKTWFARNSAGGVAKEKEK